MASGRWHHAGRPVVYLTESPSAAMLEVLVHLEIDTEDMPDNLRLLRVDIPNDVSSQNELALPEHWEEDIACTRSLGDAWLVSGGSLLMKVPSAIMPHTHNFLFNPLHPQAQLATLSVETLKLDHRLLKGT